MSRIRVLTAAVLGCFIVSIGVSSSANAYAWYPKNSSVSDVHPLSSLYLKNTGGMNGWISEVTCRAVIAGTTPSNGNQLNLSMSVSECSTFGASGTGIDPVTQVRLYAEKPTFDPYKGTQVGGGFAAIGDSGPTTPSLVLRFKSVFYDCTVKMWSAGGPEGFALNPNFYSTPKPAEWGLKQIPIPVDVTGTSSWGPPCAPSGGKWTVETLHAATYPYLEIR